MQSLFAKSKANYIHPAGSLACMYKLFICDIAFKSKNVHIYWHVSFQRNYLVVDKRTLFVNDLFSTVESSSSISNCWEICFVKLLHGANMSKRDSPIKLAARNAMFL